MGISEFNSNEFVFRPPPPVAWARRVLIKPSANYPLPSPVTTSGGILGKVIDGIRQVSEADILIIEGNPTGESVYPIYRTLRYDFSRVLMLDVKDSILVEVENPLPHPFIAPTFWAPNVLLSSDYLITIAPMKMVGKVPYLSIMNLISLLPVAKYKGEAAGGWNLLYSLGIEQAIADLYFTLPFDLGIIDATKKLTGLVDPTQGEVEDVGKVFVGEPYELDRELTKMMDAPAEYLELIKTGRCQMECGTAALH
ncbi:MAG: DUF362 domain-containing protein [Dehalococcoidia bacterium]|nr:DUF362 domain-containing protein [Dehalococcoidia bacterium]